MLESAAGPIPSAVRDAILAWYHRHGRNLPWRQTRDPYAILVAEIMLQQTGVERVLPKYAEFLATFPTLTDLAAAPREAVIRRWAPLGYNRRAVALHEIAHAAIRDFDGRLPCDRDTLRTLRGIGDYTAGAVACFAFGDQRAFLDTNIRRVIGRICLGAEPARNAAGERAARQAAEASVPPGQAYDWHQSLMDLGATVCRPVNPACLMCPARAGCRFAAGDRAIESTPGRTVAAPFVGSSRYYRGRVVDSLRQAESGLELDAIGACVKSDYTPADRAWLGDLLAGLAADGLVRRVAESEEKYGLG